MMHRVLTLVGSVFGLVNYKLHVCTTVCVCVKLWNSNVTFGILDIIFVVGEYLMILVWIIEADTVGILDKNCAEMRGMCFGLVIVLLAGILNVGKAEIYIVTVEGEPVISYKGDIDGFEATASESDEKIDTTRYLQFLFSCFTFSH